MWWIEWITQYMIRKSRSFSKLKVINDAKDYN